MSGQEVFWRSSCLIIVENENKKKEWVYKMTEKEKIETGKKKKKKRKRKVRKEKSTVAKSQLRRASHQAIHHGRRLPQPHAPFY